MTISHSGLLILGTPRIRSRKLWPVSYQLTFNAKGTQDDSKILPF